MDPQPLPETIGRFRIQALLGAGGMGTVYKAVDPNLQRTVAVKTVRPDATSPQHLERFQREAWACGRLQHPNIVTVFEAGQAHSLVYIVMEFLTGDNLAVTLQRGALTLEAKLGMLIQVLDALQHAHTQGVIHRDIKPSNVHCLPDGSIKLLDFGLARVVQADTLTSSGMILGTPHYAAPEQLRGAVVDARSDVYSTGVLAYEMVAGRHPFAGDDSSVTAVMLRVLSEAPPPIDVVEMRRFPGIESIISRAMAKSPGDRYASARDMRDELAALLESSRTPIRAESTVVVSGRPLVAPLLSAAATPTAALSNPLDGRVPLATPLSTGGTTRAAGRRTSSRWPLVTAAAVIGVGVVVSIRSLMPPPGDAVASTAAGLAATATVTPGPPLAPSLPAPTASSSAAASRATPEPIALPRPTGDVARTDGQRPSDRGSPAPVAPAEGSTSGLTTTPVAGPPDADAKELFYARKDPSPEAGPGSTGLRYRVLQRLESGLEQDVAADKTFRSGDRIRLAFESNTDGYLYVVQQGSSGGWTLLFPHPEVNGGRNDIRRFEPYYVPSEDWFEFDARPGTESLFVFLSREPLARLPGLNQASPAPDSLSASVVEEVRQTVKSRDLVLRRDLPSGAGQATYVVNRNDIVKAVAVIISLAHGQ